MARRALLTSCAGALWAVGCVAALALAARLPWRPEAWLVIGLLCSLPVVPPLVGGLGIARGVRAYVAARRSDTTSAVAVIAVALGLLCVCDVLLGVPICLGFGTVGPTITWWA